ncbi:hypothetical protein FWC31_03000 [Candidatus Saccharibacteria bacterium]|nr:hypothetical protein [Candidatus Saccharibacteria bacterium]
MLNKITQIIKRHQTLVIALVGFLVMVVLVVLSLWPRLSRSSEDTPPPPTTTTEVQTIAINNYSNYVKNLSNTRQADIESNLYWTVKGNLSWIPSATSAMIREGSYEQTTYDQAKQIYFTTFIVDISNLQQSYRINDYYSPLPPEITGLVDYTTLVLCPEQDELIYDYFKCTDRMKTESGG